jgi:glyoxylase-like metal-dependent hydrolase (beta-lactamase superfamily II)
VADAEDDDPAGLIEHPPPPPVRRVHHLDCVTMCPVGASLYNEHGRLVGHCLLVETEQGLVLVDTGTGTNKAASTATWHVLYRPRFDVAATAKAQIEKLGHKIDDVRHVIVTHLDLDHAGGLADFPNAEVHVLADELEAARDPRGFVARQRYRPKLWAHDVKWRTHDVKGERWYGFPCVRDIPGLPPEILLVPLRGHTEGHTGVAVDVGGRWLLHCGDAYFHSAELDPEPYCPPLSLAHQRLMAVDEAARRANQKRLRELKRGVGDGVDLFCAHDPDDLARFREG